MAGKSDSLKTIFYALGANFAIFVSKLAAAMVTGSGAMLAEAVHSLADCANQGLLLVGMRKAKRAASPEHPLGYGKAIYFWSFLVALLLFSVGGTFSFYEGVHKLDHPEPLRSPWIAVSVLAFGLVAESFSMWGCLREVNKARGDKNLWSWVRHSRQSELIVVFGEDLAALVGLSLAMVAVVATMLTGNPFYDACGSIAIGVLLGVIAVFLARQISKLLVGKSAEADVREAIAQFVRDQPDVESVFNQITLQLGPDLMVATKAQMRRDLSGREMVEAINRVEKAMKEQFPEIRWSFFEPDFED